MEAMSEDPVQRWRTQIESEFGLYSAAEAARRAGSRGHSRTAAVHRWVEAGKVFAVTSTAGLDAYAGFCFGEDGRPVPGIGAVIKAFAGRVSGWDLAGWFLTPNAALGDRRPVDCLDDIDGLRAATSR
jgi:hypothetical protein